MSVLSHRYIPPDTVNSFYPVWNTHGVVNKHALIYGHTHTHTQTHTMCSTGTQTHACTHMCKHCLCSLPQCADMIIKQATQPARLLIPVTPRFFES